MDIGTLAAVITVAVAVTGGISTLLSHWLSRRAASGRVATTEAAVLWQQSQHIRTMLLAEKDKAEEQRDRLIEAYTRQVLPVLAEINTAVTAIAAVVAENNQLGHAILIGQGGGKDGLPASVQDGDGKPL